MPEIKIRTGVPGLDAVLGGGFPAKSTILLEAVPGTGKTSFCRQFVKEGAGESQRCVYVVTSEPVEQAIEGLKTLGLTSMEHISFIDGYSWRVSGSEPQSLPNVHRLGSLTELNELTRLIKQEVKGLGAGGGARIVIDSISDMLLYAEPASVFKFLQLFVGLVKGSNAAAVVVLEEGLHEAKHVATISYICDGTIFFKLEGNSRGIYVKRMFNTVHPLKWIPFVIGKQGVEIKVSDFFA